MARATKKATARGRKKVAYKRPPRRKGAKKPKKSTGRGRKSKADILARLSPDEAAEVLQELLDADPSLRPKAVEIATTVVTTVDADQIAGAVSSELMALDIDDLGGRAGRTPWGYVSPTEAAWEILGETIQPFIDNALRLAELGHEVAAMTACRGLLLGLYNVRDAGADDVLGWATDFPEEAASEALSQVKRALGRRSGKISMLQQMISGMDEWSWLDRAIGRRK